MKKMQLPREARENIAAAVAVSRFRFTWPMYLTPWRMAQREMRAVVMTRMRAEVARLSGDAQ